MKKLIIFFAFILSTNIFCQVGSSNEDNKSKLPNYDPRPISSGKQVTNEIPSEIKSKCSEFFDLIIAKNYDKAFDDFTLKSFVANKAEQYKALLAQTKTAINLYGDIKSVDFVNAEKATNNYYKVRYLANHNDYPTRWIFTFYNSPKYGWIVLNIKFDDLSEFLFYTD